MNTDSSYYSSVTGMTYYDNAARVAAESAAWQMQSLQVAQSSHDRHMRRAGGADIEASGPATRNLDPWVGRSWAKTTLTAGAAGMLFGAAPYAGIVLPWTHSAGAIGGLFGCGGGTALLGAVAAARATDERLGTYSCAFLGFSAIMLSVAAGFSTGFGVSSVYPASSADKPIKVYTSDSDPSQWVPGVAGAGVALGVGLSTFAAFKILKNTSKLHF